MELHPFIPELKFNKNKNQHITFTFTNSIPKNLKNKAYILLSIILLSLSIRPVDAQSRKVMNLPKYDKEPYHFGFILAMNQMYYMTKPLISTYTSPGFAIGILGNMRLGEYFDMRIIPTLAFGGRELAAVSNPDYYYQIPSTFVDLPLHIKYRSKRLNNMAAYVVAGPKYSLDIASTKKQNQAGFVTYRSDISADVGVGFDFYTNYFKFGTELKMSYGFTNILKKGSELIGTEQLKNKVFQLSFTFE